MTGGMTDETFNRTIVELKHCSVSSTIPCLIPFNRTIVELKHAYVMTSYQLGDTFNRTIVELKHESQNHKADDGLCF